MRAKINQEVLKKINFLFKRAKTKNPALARKYVVIAKQIAKRNNIKLPQELRRSFCHKCNSYFTIKNTKIRINKGKKSIKCLACGKYFRYLLKGGKR